MKCKVQFFFHMRKDSSSSSYVRIFVDSFKFEKSFRFCKQETEAVVRRCSIKKVFLEIWQNSQENNCPRESFLIKLQAIKKDSLAQVFSCGFCEISKDTFFIEHLRWLPLINISLWASKDWKKGPKFTGSMNIFLKHPTL